mgnify:CR=1 FL=1
MSEPELIKEIRLEMSLLVSKLCEHYLCEEICHFFAEQLKYDRRLQMEIFEIEKGSRELAILVLKRYTSQLIEKFESLPEEPSFRSPLMEATTEIYLKIRRLE